MTQQEDRLRTKANLCFGLTAVILIGVMIMLVIPKFNELKEKKTELAQTQEAITSSELDLEAERLDYRQLKEAYSERATQTEETISTVLPSSPEETNLVRSLESYTNQLRESSGFFVMDAISLGKAKDSSDVDYLTIPFQLTFETTRETLMSFLRYIENSGDLEASVNDASRLFDLESISFSLNEDKETGEKSISASLSVNTYSLPYSLEEEAAK